MTFNIIQQGTEAYEEMLHLRIRVLLNPIGVPATYINREEEKADLMIGAYENKVLVGCCVLTPRNEKTIQLRQMAVLPTIQQKGIGSRILRFAEGIALQRGYKILMMHARSEVQDFYLKNGYAISGDEFMEVGIKHRLMQKTLQP